MKNLKKIKKGLKISVLSLLGLGVLLFVVLVVHIAIMVKSHTPKADATIQMARVDFSQPLDSFNVVTIKHDVMAQKGVASVFYNTQSHIIIYTFDNRQNDAESIYDKAIKQSGLASKRAVVSAQDMLKGCPAFNNNSFYGQMTALVSRFVN